MRADHPPPPPAPYNQPFPPAHAFPEVEAQPPPPPAHQTGVFDGTDAPFPPAPPLVHAVPHATATLTVLPLPAPPLAAVLLLFIQPPGLPERAQNELETSDQAAPVVFVPPLPLCPVAFVGTTQAPADHPVLFVVSKPPVPSHPPVHVIQLPKDERPPAVPGLPSVLSVVCDVHPVPPAPTVAVSVAPKIEAGNVINDKPPAPQAAHAVLFVPTPPFLQLPPQPPAPIQVICTDFALAGFVHVFAPVEVKICISVGVAELAATQLGASVVPLLCNTCPAVPFASIAVTHAED